MGWTKEQEKAIHSYGHNIIVSAGAGSGKTAVLSERVLEFVKKGFRIDEFLILTFTNLAAGEMKHRIRKKLEDANLEDANYVDSSDICTFDSFAASIVKKNHFKLGLSPNLSNVDSNVISVLKRNIINEIFDRYYQEKNPIFEKMIKSYCFKDDEEFRDLVLKIDSVAELEIDKEEYLNDFILNYYNEDFYDDVFAKIEDVLFNYQQKLIDSLYELPAVPLNKKTTTLYVDKVLLDAQELIDAGNYETIIAAIKNFNIAKIPNGVEDKESHAYAKNLLKKIKERVLDKLPSTKAEFIELLESQKEFAELLISIAKELDKRQWKYKMDKQVFEFNDIAKFALKVVQENSDIQQELKEKYKMIMIDEYQDTSLIQEEFISLIADNNVYMVGDIKQSIYAFRNARCDIFKDKYDEYKNSKVNEAIDMKKNFRSRQEVLDDINTIFSTIMSDSIGGANYIKDHMIEFGNQDYLIGRDKNQNYSSRFIIYPHEKKKEDRTEKEIRIIAEDIIRKINSHYQVFVPGDPKKNIPPTTRDASFKDFCILMDRQASFEMYKKVFTELKIPLYIENDENIKNTIIVQILTNLLILIKCIKNNDYSSSEFVLSYLSIVRSFVFEKKDDEIYKIVKSGNYENSEVIVKLKNIIDSSTQLSNYLLVEKVVFELDIYSKLVLIGNVKKNEIYLDEFLKTFHQMGELDYSLDDFITYLKYIEEYNLKINLSSTGSSLDSVKIMNIHKSKGLEFPFIYFPGLDVKFNRQEEKNKFSISSKFGLLIPSLIDEKINPLKFIDRYLANLDDLSEKIRLLYVSLTRAREQMIFVMNDDLEAIEVEDALSFSDLLTLVLHKFEVEIYAPKGKIKLENLDREIYYQNFDFEDVCFSLEKQDVTKASKNLKLGTNKELLEFGTRLHEILEVIDFKKPDYSLVENEYYKNKIKAFIESDLLKNIGDAIVYKEYEFKDQNYSGIIDLMLVHNDHIDIIDYKTKNIDDEDYDKQLRVYKEVITKQSKLPINLYLYSINDMIYRKID